MANEGERKQTLHAYFLARCFIYFYLKHLTCEKGTFSILTDKKWLCRYKPCLRAHNQQATKGGI